MSSVNHVVLLGRCGKQVELKTIGNGNSVANFSIATSEVYKDKTSGERKETTEWHNCVAWNQLAEIASKYLHKGDNVYVEGKMKTRSWEKDGVTRYITEILLDKIVLLGGKKSDDSQSSGNTQPQPSQSANSSYSDDIPF